MIAYPDSRHGEDPARTNLFTTPDLVRVAGLIERNAS